MPNVSVYLTCQESYPMIEGRNGPKNFESTISTYIRLHL